MQKGEMEMQEYKCSLNPGLQRGILGELLSTLETPHVRTNIIWP